MLQEKFCARLRVIRAERGLSQENVATLLDMSLNGYAKIERGETDITINKIEQISKVLDVDVADLLQIGTTNNYISNAERSVAQGNSTFNINMDSEIMNGIFARLETLEAKRNGER